MNPWRLFKLSIAAFSGVDQSDGNNSWLVEKAASLGALDSAVGCANDRWSPSTQQDPTAPSGVGRAGGGARARAI